MQSNLILTAAQAQAVYSAMCALNNVGGRVNAVIPLSPSDGAVDTHTANHITALPDGRILIQGYREGERCGPLEIYPDQSAFAAAYGLPVAAPDLAAALRVAYSDIQRLPGHTIDMLGRIEAALELSAA